MITRKTRDQLTKVRSNNEIISLRIWDERKQPIIYTAHVAIISGVPEQTE